MSRSRLFPCLLLGLLAFVARAAPGFSYARVISDPALLESGRGLDAHAVMLARADLESARAALGDGVVERWLKARIDLARGEFESSHHALERLARSDRVHDAGLAPHLLRQLDQDRAEAAFRSDDPEALRRVLESPLAEHEGDALWLAQRARARWSWGLPAAEDFSIAWEAAAESDRRRPVFGWRALALHHEGEERAAAERWLDHVEALRWPQELRAAIELFDSTPQLAELMDRDGVRERAIQFYARVLRRDRAFELAERGCAGSDSVEAARCFVLAAEQLYRLRRHDELARWLEREWPSALDDEGRAALVAYPWGVRRRAGASPEIAEGFEEVWRNFPGSARGLEALWEAAWMYELSGLTLEAEALFLEYATQQPAGPLASSAAARAIGLPAWRKDDELVLERYASLRPMLQNVNDVATARWLVEGAASRLGLSPGSGQDENDELRHDPFRFPPPHPWAAQRSADESSREALLQELLRQQALAFQHLAQRIGIELEIEADGELSAAADFYELGLFLEGDYLLNSVAAATRRDAGRQLRAAWLAWRMGRAERQARIGFQLRLLLGSEADAELDVALDRIAHPTPFARELIETAAEQGLPAGLLWAVMRRESFYDPAVISLAGAYGLLQLLPSTAAQMAELLGDAPPDTEALRQPLWNLRYGSRYLRQLFEECGADSYRVLAAYNAGEANGERWAARRPPEAPPQSILFLISYSETRAYVYHVLRFWRLYADSYPSLGSFDALRKE